MVFSTQRLQGRALEQKCVERVSQVGRRHGIRMKTAVGAWVFVTKRMDTRVPRILATMETAAKELTHGLIVAGWRLQNAEQVVELESLCQHSVDLVLVGKHGELLFVEMKWSNISIGEAMRRAKVSAEWLPVAAFGCTLVGPRRGVRKPGKAAGIGFLAVTPSAWKLTYRPAGKSQLVGGEARGAMSRDAAREVVRCTKKRYLSGYQKRKGSRSLKAQEEEYRRSKRGRRMCRKYVRKSRAKALRQQKRKWVRQAHTHACSYTVCCLRRGCRCANCCRSFPCCRLRVSSRKACFARE